MFNNKLIISVTRAHIGVRIRVIKTSCNSIILHHKKSHKKRYLTGSAWDVYLAGGVEEGGIYVGVAGGVESKLGEGGYG